MEESNQNNHGEVTQTSKKAKPFHGELLNLQREQMKQLETEAKEKEKDREFFLEFGKTLKNKK